MYKNKTILAIVPARGGSKGIKLKNLRPLNGVPLVALAGQFAARLKEIDRAVVSTDHDEIARVAEESGLAAPFRRPEDLSGDRIGDWDVLTHALKFMEELDARRYDIVLMLQPTSPMRKPEHVYGALDHLIDNGFDAVWSLSPTDAKAHPYKQLTVQDGRLDYYDQSGKKIIARQELKTLYARNGIVYAITRECLLEHGDIAGEKTGALVIEEPMVNIDTQLDLDFAEFLMERYPEFFI